MITRIEKHNIRMNRIKIWINQLSMKELTILSVHVLFLVVISLISDLDYSAKIALFAFLSALTLWITTQIPAGFVAISLIVFIIVMNAKDPALLYNSLSEEVVWLMVGSFIIGEAVHQSGLANRLTLLILKKSNNKTHILFGVSSLLFTSAFFIPSTSGRAALAMPIIKQLSGAFSSKEKSVMGILAPIIILMSTSATLIGAGSHLIGIALLESTVHQSISYIQWLIWGVPFSIVITLLSFITIKALFWPKGGDKTITEIKEEGKDQNKSTLSRNEKKTMILMAFLIAGWVTQSIHIYDSAFITMLGAVMIMMPKYGIIHWKQGIKSVSLNLIIFVAAATALGKVLVDTGVVKWMEEKMFTVLQLFIGSPDWMIVLGILLVTVTSHLYITSHTTRAIVFIPGLLLFSETIGINPSAVVFISLIGMNYCVTVPVSSKALLLFYEESNVSYDARELLKTSMILMPLYIIVMMVFYFTYWEWTGMHL
jgi:anion transporter